MNKYACYIAPICPITLQLYSTHRLHLYIKKQTLTSISMLLPYMCQQQVFPSNDTYVTHGKFVHGQIQGNYVRVYIYISYELTAFKNITRNISIYILQYWYMPTNICVTLHMSVPLHVYCTLHIDQHMLYI